MRLAFRFLALRVLLSVFVFAILAAPAARATCPAYSFSQGPAGTLYKANLAAAGLTFSKVNFSGGYTANFNFVPNADCTVSWLSISAGGLLGVGAAASGPGAAVNLTPIAGIGVYNSLVRIYAGYDGLNLGANSTGLFIGKPVAANFSVFVGTGINFDLSALASSSSPLEEARSTAPPQRPGYIRP